MRRLLLLGALATLGAGCGSSHSSAPPAPGTTSTQTETAQTTVQTTTVQTTVGLRIYLLRDGKVAPVSRRVPETRAVARAALAQLVAGPTADERSEGLTTSLPARLALGPPTAEGDTLDLGASPDLSAAQTAQIVYTMTQFPSVNRVRLGALVFTRNAFEGQTPAILVESPLPGETVSSPLRVRGTANTFEATFQLELLDSSGHRVAGHFVMATSGSGQRGTFDTTISAPSASGRVTLVVYENSAENGRRIHEVRIPLVIG
jgi:germination protein M